MVFIYRAAIVALVTVVSALIGFGVHELLPEAHPVESKGMVGSVADADQPSRPHAPISSMSVNAITSVALYRSATGRRSSARWAFASSSVRGPAP
jgi:hypothetical protein